jgi:cytochrome c553
MFKFPTQLILTSGLVAFGFASGQETPGERARRNVETASPDVPARTVAGDAVSAKGTAFFEKRIRPVLVAECYECHSADAKKVRGGLLLDTRDGTRQGGDSGPVIVPGSPARSLLIQALGHGDPKRAMPPKKKLDAAIVRDFEEWVRMGAPDPRGDTKVAPKYFDIEKGRKHWAFQPRKKVVALEVKNTAWARTDVDRYILAALETKSLKPVDDSDRRTLLRRVTFDLTGLPPTPADVEAFAADTSPEAFEKVVDRLLASQRFGEKWARHWLDVARYAESTGKTVNFSYPHAWRYRDYVIAAFNADKPYNQFIKEQLAGDLMKSDDPKVMAERTIATGFLALGPKTLNERSGVKFELDVVDEQIDVTTQAFLGITVSCARCHDHKFDPIPQKDYYALAGIFRSTETCYGTVRYINAQRTSPLLSLPKDANQVAAVDKLTDAERKRVEGQIKAVRDSMKKMKDPIQQFFSTGQVSLLQARLDAYDPDGNPKLLAMGVRDKPMGPAVGTSKGKFGGVGGFTYDATRTIADSPVYLRGEPDQPGNSRVPRGTLEVMTKTPLKFEPTSSGRLELAEWIASNENPLTARVMVNRVWLHLFGRGLVPSADDFGLAGRPPTHPELLDHLAHNFMDNGWSVKKLIKHLVMSRVYQLSSTATPGAVEVDPDNTLRWRMTPRRLDAESLRDALLAVSEQLDTKPPGGSVVARAGEGPVARFRSGGDSVAAAINDPKNTHRSIYLPIIRDNLPEVLALFDGADPALITGDRATTIVPSQGLFLLNNTFVLRAADAAANKLLKNDDTDAERIRGAFLRFYSRPPTAKEQAAAETFLKAYRAQLTKERVAAAQQERESWSAFCQTLFASADFQYRK